MRDFKTMINYVWPICLLLAISACTKKDEPVKLAEVNVEEFDPGHLIITLYDDPAYVDSILYINNSQNTSFKIENTEFTGYDPVNNHITQINRNLLNGQTNDQVQCCFYLNSQNPQTVKVNFDGTNANDSVSTSGNPVFCINGAY